MITSEAPEGLVSFTGKDRWSEFFRRAAFANWGLGALMRFTSGPILQLVALQVFALDVQRFLVLTVILGLVNFTQLVGLGMYYRQGAFEALLRCYRARTWALVVLSLCPFLLPISTDAAIWLWALLIVVINASHSMGFSVSWPPIVKAGTNQQSRGRVTSRLRAIQTVVAASLAIIIAVMGPGRFDGVAFTAMALLFAAFSFGATKQVEWMRSNVQLDHRPSGMIWAQVSEDVRFLLSDRRAKRFLCVVIALGFAGLPLQVFYLDELLRFPRVLTFWFLAATTVVGIGSMLLWGAIIDKRGGVFAARVCLLCVIVGLSAQMGLLISPAIVPGVVYEAAILISMLIANVGTQGLALLWFNEALRVLPAKSTTAGVMLFGCAYESSTVLASFLAGTIWTHSARAASDTVVTPFVWYLAAVCGLAAVTWAAIGRLGVFVQDPVKGPK